MSEPLELDDLLDLWEPELEEEAARFDIIPSRRPPPIRCKKGGLFYPDVGFPSPPGSARTYGFRLCSTDGGRSGYLQPGWVA